jgi:hypothetical protein
MLGGTKNCRYTAKDAVSFGASLVEVNREVMLYTYWPHEGEQQ